MLRIISTTALLIATAMPALASDLSWRDVSPKLEGCWEGTGLGGDVWECWVVHENGRADGMFLMRKDGAPGFAEILTIDEFEGAVQMRLKHVNGDMTGWEEKDDFTKFDFVEASADSLSFKGLKLNFVGEDALQIDLTMKMSDGETRIMPFNFTRVATISSPAD